VDIALSGHRDLSFGPMLACRSKFPSRSATRQWANSVVAEMRMRAIAGPLGYCYRREPTPEEQYKYDCHIEQLRSFPRLWLSEQDITDLRAAGDVVEDVPAADASTGVLIPPCPAYGPEPDLEPPRSVESEAADLSRQGWWRRAGGRRVQEYRESRPRCPAPNFPTALIRRRVRVRFGRGAHTTTRNDATGGIIQ
jgi:hypothetical protein